jgi:hypothetical protein
MLEQTTKLLGRLRRLTQIFIWTSGGQLSRASDFREIIIKKLSQYVKRRHKDERSTSSSGNYSEAIVVQSKNDNGSVMRGVHIVSDTARNISRI